MADARQPPSVTALLVGTAITAVIFGYMLGTASSLQIFSFPSLRSAPKPRGKKRTDTYDDSSESSSEEVDGNLLDHAPNWVNSMAADRRDGLKYEEPKAEKKDKKALKKKIKGGEKKVEAVAAKAPLDERANEECKLVLVVRTDLGMTKGISPISLSFFLLVKLVLTVSGKIAAQCSHATLACYKTHLELQNSTKSTVLRRWERQGQAKVALQVKSEEELEILQAKAISLGLVAEVIADAGRTQIASGSHTVLGIGPAPKSLIDEVTGHLKLL